MRTAILGCIHGNLAALQAVLSDAARAGVDRVYCAGDIVGWGPQPRETLELIRSRGIPSIRGHDDRRVVDLALDDARDAAGRASATTCWALARLDPEDVKTLSALPLSYGFHAGGRTVIVVHGTPRDEDEAIDPDAKARRLEAYLILAGADVLVCAHGHYPFVRELEGGRLVVNVGSVGRPFDGDPRAAYVLLRLEPGAPARAEVRRVVYDLAPVVAAAESNASPARVRDELRARAAGMARGAAGRGLVLTAPFRGPTTIAELARDALDDAARKLRKAADESADPVAATHDVRVGCRRALAALDVFSDLLPERARASLEDELHAILKGLSPARDHDVTHAILVGSVTSDPVASVALDASLEAIERERARTQELRDRALHRASRRSLRKSLRDLSSSLDRSGARAVPGRLATIGREARELLATALTPGSTERELHEFRIAVKRLRYALEPFERVDPAAGLLAAALGEVQDALGAARDRARLARALIAEAQRLEGAGRASLAAAVTLLAQSYRTEADLATAAFRREGPGARARIALDVADLLGASSLPGSSVDELGELVVAARNPG